MTIEMMAVGDSLYNGVRSLTITADLAARSVPAQVAAAFRWNFVSPDYPRPILADFEKVFRDPLTGTIDLIKNAMANAHAWLAGGPWSRQPLFHNLAIAQQVAADLTTANYAASLQTAEQLAKLGAGIPLAQLPQLYQALNTCFVLNPQRTDGNKHTAVDILAAARPKRLLVQIGANDGLWNLLLLGDPTNFDKAINPIKGMTDFVSGLVAECGAIEHIYVNLFPKPSAIANLMPRTDDVMPSNGYFDQYLGRLTMAGGISGSLMQQIDEWVNTSLNPRIVQTFAPLGDRVHFVDLYALNSSYDRKNGIATKSVIVNAGGTMILLDNLPLEVLPIFGGRRDGGLFGLDNLHPSVVGYSLIAQAVCDVIARTEHLAPVVVSQQAAYDADTLLHNLPPSIGLADFALDFIGGFVSPLAAPIS